MRRKIKDNQLVLVFEGGKLIIPPLIHNRAAVWEPINGMPAEVRDDGVPKAKPMAWEDIVAAIGSLKGPTGPGAR